MENLGNQTQWWWNFLNNGLIATLVSVIIATIVSFALYFLNSSLQEKLTANQFKNDAFLKFGALGQEMWLLASHAQSLHGRQEFSKEFMNSSLEMVYFQGRLRSLRLPLLMHFDDSEERLSKQLLELGNTYQKIRDSLLERPLDREKYGAEQNKFHQAYARIYADLALQIQKGHRASQEEIERAALIVMVK